MREAKSGSVWWKFMVHTVLLGAAGCGGPDEWAGATESDVSAIASEQPGVADFIGDDTGCPNDFCGYFQDPNRTFVSHSIARHATAGCTGSWIGPNIFMSAGHCGASGNQVVQSYSYLDGQTNPQVFGFTCGQYLVQSIQQDNDPSYVGAVDVRLIYCPNITMNGLTLPPGVHFGTLDWDIRDVPVGTGMYKLWQNPVVNLGNATHILHSAGTITSITNTYGFQTAKTYENNACVNQGASGSPSFSTDWHRILIGPHALGGANPTLPCTTWANGVQAKEVFWDWYIDPSTYPGHRNDTQISSLGLNPNNYSGWLDWDLDYLFDIQKDLEALLGESSRNHYWLGFESRRRNAQWQKGSFATFFPDHVTPPGPPWGILHHSSSSATLIASKSLPLKNSQRYRVALRTRTFQAGNGNALQLKILYSFGGPTTVTLPTVADGQNKWHVFEVTTSFGAPYAIELRSTALLNIDLWYLSIIEDGSVMDLDFADKREGWRNGNTGARAFIIPRGNGGTPDWAVVARRDTSISASNDWSAINEHLALVPTKSYQLCFSHRAPSGSGSGRIELYTSTTVLYGANFTSSGTWTSSCHTFTAQTDHTRLRFGNRTSTNATISTSTIS